MKLAIVILNWNGCEMMRKYLPSVLRCSQSEDVKVFVADNGSTDDSVKMLKKEFPDVELIILDQNYGFAEGYNRALAEIDSKYYLLLNSDVEIRQEGWTTPLIEYMDANNDTGACQPKLLSLRNPEYFEYAGAAGGFIDKFGYPYCRGRIFDKIEKDNGQYDGTVASLMWATGAALMVRAEDYWYAGGLDSRFFAHMEEIDLCWRLRSLGRKVVCIPQSTAYHLGGASLEQGNPRKTFLNFRNNMLMLYKNLPSEELFFVMFVRFFLDLLASLTFLLKNDKENAKAVIKAIIEFFKIRKNFANDRKTIQERVVLTHIPERTEELILFSKLKR